ncbi:hypothetical protein BV22DRAFT_1036160 [Leucogyrophana mollusca]|uniref:Uncharacterized protein n=1 Tax=Leucogyrophana mollusca TaxID=85980 RepID=A0ACB8BD17_9AGAM|nr:hypothetical protein BV22DRAFT_1036160 [Leucogyrophana mollusca]
MVATYIQSQHHNDAGIMYCFSRSNCEEVAQITASQQGITTLVWIRRFGAGVAYSMESPTLGPAASWKLKPAPCIAILRNMS